MRLIPLILLATVLAMPAQPEGTVLKDTKDCWGNPVHLRVADGLLYMTMDDWGPYQPVAVKEGFVEAVRALEASGERYDIDTDRMSWELYELLDPLLTDGREVVYMDVQEEQILLLLENPEGGYTLRVAVWNGDGYDVLDNPTFPEGTYMDTIHMEDGSELWIPGLDELDALGMYLDRTEEGDWKLYLKTDVPVGDFDWRWHAVIDQNAPEDGSNDGYYYGDLPLRGDFETFDVAECPLSLEQALKWMDRSGWAVVNNPNPKDRLNLRVSPDKDAKTLGKFYNKTPVRVIGTQGEWSQVVIGEAGEESAELTGWMMTKYLAFGEAMDEVACAFPVDKRAGASPVIRASVRDVPDRSAPETWKFNFTYDSIIGVLGDEWYIVMNPYEGWVGYVPQRGGELENP